MSDISTTVPIIDYTSRDYQSLVSDMVASIPTFFPNWTNTNASNLGVALLELWAYEGDILNYYIDRVAAEAFLPTAQQPQSIYNIAQLLDYTPYSAQAASVSLQFTIVDPSPTAVVIPAATQVQTATGIIFETTTSLTIWGDNTTPTTQTQTGNGTASQIMTITGSWAGTAATMTVTVNGTTYTNATGNVFSGSGSGNYYVINGNEIVFGTGSNGGTAPPSNSTIQAVYYPYLGSEYSASVNAQQGITVSGEVEGTSNGQANQSFTLFNFPVVASSVAVQVTSGSSVQNWTYFPSIIDAGPSDYAYTIQLGTNGAVTIIFGDGITGAIPSLGATISASYLAGGGSAGNVAAGTLTTLVVANSSIVSVTNPLAAAGGSDAETLDHIRAYAPQSVAAANRCVTAADYASLALSQPNISKASAEAASLTLINLYIHPGGDFVASTSALQTLVDGIAPSLTNSNQNGYLDLRKMAYTTVVVYAPQYHNTTASTVTTGYVPVDVSVNFSVGPNYGQTSTTAAVQAAISNLFSFSAVGFGSAIRLGEVYSAIYSVPGVLSASVTNLNRHELPPPTVPTDVICGVDEIPQLNAAGLVLTPSGGLPNS